MGKKKRDASHHKKVRNDERPNGKKWKKGLAPDKR